MANLGRMKAIPRSGWLSHGVSLIDVESVADHSFSTCALSMLLSDLEIERGALIDVERVLRMATLHDLAESLTFDISRAYLQYMGGRGQEIKREIERSAWKVVAKGINDRDIARGYAALQSEYVANESKEARIVHAADSIDILLQVVDYQRRGYPRRLLSDLWKERCKMVARSGLHSAQALLKLILSESIRLDKPVKVK